MIRIRMILLAVMLILPGNVSAAFNTELVLQVDGVRGQSELQGHRGAIDVLSFDWGVGPTETKRPVICQKNLTITKKFDDASFDFAVAALTGELLRSVRLIAVQTGGELQPVDFLTISLLAVRVQSYQTSSANKQIIESVTFSFAEANMTYVPRDQGGRPLPQSQRTFNYQVPKTCLPK